MTIINNSKYSFIHNGIDKKDKVFRCKEDFKAFENILQQSLKISETKHSKFSKCQINSFDIVSYCVTNQQIDLLINGHKNSCVQRVFRNTLYEYCLYFRKKYPHLDSHIFNDIFYVDDNVKSDQIPSLLRFIHQSHAQFKKWPYSSYQDYLTSPREWINIDSTLRLFPSFNKYRRYIDNDKEMEIEKIKILKSIKDKSHIAKFRIFAKGKTLK